MNSCTGDQYLSIIVTANLYKKLYKKLNLEPKLLGRSIEDSVSVTSVLIPWNSCGITQSTVLGVATLSYLPFCVFNYMCPIMSIAISFIGYKISTNTRTNE
jgi:NhaC family Na+:H+ antiporter